MICLFVWRFDLQTEKEKKKKKEENMLTKFCLAAKIDIPDVEFLLHHHHYNS